jgi:hypothetical protein
MIEILHVALGVIIGGMVLACFAAAIGFYHSHLQDDRPPGTGALSLAKIFFFLGVVILCGLIFLLARPP